MSMRGMETAESDLGCNAVCILCNWEPMDLLENSIWTGLKGTSDAVS